MWRILADIDLRASVECFPAVVFTCELDYIASQRKVPGSTRSRAPAF
jgi:hypothetical protein